MKIEIDEKEYDNFIETCFKRNDKGVCEFDRLTEIMHKENLVENFIRTTGKYKGNKAIKLTMRGKFFVMALREPTHNEDDK